MTPRTKEQNEEIRLRRLVQIRQAAADVFLDKGMALEIRDVAAQAGLGYGTVYHYYSNKGDLLHDVLWVAMERAGAWLEEPDGGHGGHLSALVVCLLEQWADDRGLYLLYKLAGDGFRLLPEARAMPLADAFRREVLLPFAAALGGEPGGPGVPAGSGRAALGRQPFGGSLPEEQVRRAEMLLAALAGCALLSLRRGTLRQDAENIVQIVHLRSEKNDYFEIAERN
ncbi:TetR/AcrR family transcriptional regulator [Paenibacillus macerans]|uniref:TetR/AcrR family transcriptional regulator n=1 Tax=Paenibacillus macerans TaxID=44252 RepID=UPI00203F6307|nr:TetR/AcrR family transcriptional regulator [Paenibacillus macerans]MCM3698361.1 TetR/AcrR family transcriptional regulator [Paenibacillus macerans]